MQMVCKFHNFFTSYTLLDLFLPFKNRGLSSPLLTVGLFFSFSVLKFLTLYICRISHLLFLSFTFLYNTLICLWSECVVGGGSIFLLLLLGNLFLYMKRDFFIGLCINRCVLASDIISLISTRVNSSSLLSVVPSGIKIQIINI